MPAFSHAFISSASIGRDASLMSVLPSQNSTNPSPVPGPSTDGDTPGLEPAKLSATRVVIGSTVDEPEMVNSPEMASPDALPDEESLFALHAAVTRATPTIPIITRVRARII